MMDKVVILVGGLGTRMRKEDRAASLTEDQARVAGTGVKAMIPIDRPFLDYVLTVMADAGYRKVCLVIGPDHDPVRRYYNEQAPPKRLSIEYALQKKPLGTADAVASAEKFVGSDPFLMVNSDNHYPLDAVSALRGLSGPGLAGFEREALIAKSNIPADRVLKFAVTDLDDNDHLRRVIEKPTEEQLAAFGDEVYLSMNCWRFTPNVFEACRNIGLSPRGELEVTDAAQYCIDHLGEQFKVVKSASPVLDLSSQHDVGPVTELLVGTEVSF
jgi:glucose-1-phosphate thymidylyltransferase